MYQIESFYGTNCANIITKDWNQRVIVNNKKKHFQGNGNSVLWENVLIEYYKHGGPPWFNADSTLSKVYFVTDRYRLMYIIL